MDAATRALLNECESFILHSVERPMLNHKKFDHQTEHEARIFEAARDLRDKINRALAR